MRQVFNRFYTEHASTQVSALTTDGFLKRWGKLLGLDTPLSEVTDKEIGNAVYVMRQESLSGATINKHLGTLRKLCKLANDVWGYQVAKIDFALHRQPEAHYRVRYLTREESARLIAHCPPHLQDIVNFALFTGLRFGNIIGLKWEDINFKAGTITVKVKSQLEGGKNHIIYMAEELVDMLKSLTRDTQYVFAYKGHPIKSNVRKSFLSALKAAGITDFRFHDLRHTHASWLVQSGTQLSVVQDMLGHADPKTTRRYAHHSKEQYIKALGDTFKQSQSQIRHSRWKV